MSSGSSGAGGGTESPGRYQQSFERLLADPDTAADETRVAYCHLALGRVEESSEYFIRTFDEVAHQSWVARLSLVAGAPDNLRLDRSVRELYHELGGSQARPGQQSHQVRQVQQAQQGQAAQQSQQSRRAQQGTQPDQRLRQNSQRDSQRAEGARSAPAAPASAVSPAAESRAAYTIRRLLVASWLTSNTLAVPDHELAAEIADSYRLLAAMSQQADVSALYRAADAAASPLP